MICRRPGRGSLAAGLLVAAAMACQPLGPGVAGTVDLAPPNADALTLTYLGTGGWIIEYMDQMVLTGPFYSNPGFLETGVTAIESDTLEVDRGMSPYDVDHARVILVGHGHYDHLMDVPRVAARHAPEARILGSTTVGNLLGTWSGLADRVDMIEAEDASDMEHVGPWLSYRGTVRVLPLRSNHAPHFEGMTLFRGTADVPRTAPPRNASDWVDGQSYAFLVDFLDGEEVAFRVYYQDAVAGAPFGLAPDSLIAEHPVDVAIFVPATFDQVDWHPEAFIANLRPRRVLMGHWESFFKPVTEPTEAIGMSHITYFEERLSRTFDGGAWRPEIGTVFRFPRATAADTMQADAAGSGTRHR